MHKLWPALSADSFKQKFLCALLTHGTWIQTQIQEGKFYLSYLSYSPFHSLFLPHLLFFTPPTGDNLVFDIQKQHKLKTKVNLQYQSWFIFLSGKKFFTQVQTEATLDFVTSLSECDQLSLFGRKHVRMCTARTLFLVQGIMINTAGVKCSYRRLLGRLISGILSRNRQLPMASQLSYCFAMREVFSRGAWGESQHLPRL